MIYCSNCGLAAEQGKNFCVRCGAKLMTDGFQQAQEARPIQPERSPAQQTPVPMRRLCTKCGSPLEDDILFCQTCGTKNYVFQRNKARRGELLVALENCRLIKLQILKNSGVLLVYDDRVCFQGDSPGNNVILSYAEVAAASPCSALNASLCIKLSCPNGKSYIFSLSEADADSYYYVINLITDYRL